MTALMGLGHRLRMARVALGLDDGDDLVEEARRAHAAGTDLLVVRLGRPGSDDPFRSETAALADLETVRDRMPARALLGIEGADAVIERLGADVVLVPEGGSVRHAARISHEWALLGRVSPEPSHRHVDFDWLTAGADVGRAVAVAPPGDAQSAPWFAATDDADLDELVAAGVRRGWTRSPGAVEQLAVRLREAWAADEAMGPYRFAAAGLPERPRR